MRYVALMSGCAVAMLAIAGSASASTLAVNQAGVLRLDARFGEVNGVTLREQFPDQAYVVDDTAGLTAGNGCVPVSLTRARCRIFDESLNKLINDVVLDLGDRGDTSDVFTSFGFTPVEVDGGWGDDALSGASVDGYRARGGPGNDTIDRVATNGDPIDVSGGVGNDTVSTIGTVGLGSIRGGFGSDRLTIGGTAFGSIDGGPGPDVITGNGAIAGPVFGGFGNDTIDLPRAASIDCGFGRDSFGVYEGQTATRCERPLPPPSV
ncbi:MAG TPA: hypothetical protein VFY45_22040 [Baekduia sp.]|nr:hypothetical protein [Baekduia sp.]